MIQIGKPTAWEQVKSWFISKWGKVSDRFVALKWRLKTFGNDTVRILKAMLSTLPWQEIKAYLGTVELAMIAMYGSLWIYCMLVGAINGGSLWGITVFFLWSFFYSHLFAISVLSTLFLILCAWAVISVIVAPVSDIIDAEFVSA